MSSLLPHYLHSTHISALFSSTPHFLSLFLYSFNRLSFSSCILFLFYPCHPPPLSSYILVFNYPSFLLFLSSLCPCLHYPCIPLYLSSFVLVFLSSAFLYIALSSSIPVFLHSCLHIFLSSSILFLIYPYFLLSLYSFDLCLPKSLSSSIL